MHATNKYHRSDGMEGLYVICSMDPAMSGDTAAITYAVDQKTDKRYILDAHKMTAPTPARIRELIQAWTEKYKPAMWVVEKNAFQLFLTRDEEIRKFLSGRGVVMREHYTGGHNKPDPDFGVASVAPLFTEQMIELPSSHNCEGIKALIEQLVTWAPGMAKQLKQDLPMALWFAEIRAREVVNRGHGGRRHAPNRYLPRYKREQQVIVNLNEYAASREAEMDMVR